VGRLIAYGAYVPYNRLQRSAIGNALGSGGGKGTRAVASYDEDSTSMGVEAARIALRQAGDVSPRALWFATANPPYLDKTNATAIHAALGLDDDCMAADTAGSVRSGVGAIWAALDSEQPALVVLSDVRTGLPGGADEREGGDAAAALLFAGGTAPSAAEVIGRAAITDEFLERWRLPGEQASHTWEDRFGEHVYVPLAREALDAALKDAGVSIGDVDQLVVTGLHTRAVKAVAAKAGAKQVADDLTGSVGNTGTAHVGVVLADVLDRAQPGETIAVLVLADGAAAFVLRVGDAISERRPKTTVAAQVAGGRDDLGYQTFLSWRGFLTREPPRRPDPVAGAPPPSYRNEAWKFGFTGTTCEACGTRHLPPARVCVRCGAVDKMRPERLANVQATVATFTVDRLAYTPSPPLVAAILDFDGGGRFSLELTDVDPKTVAIGNRVEMTFRRLVTAGGVHNYFWKARPVRGNATGTSE
jgi:hydroxymethylglutaryl-CoA synthase